MERLSKNPNAIMIQKAVSDSSTTIRISSAEGFSDFMEINIVINGLKFRAIDIEAFYMLLSAYSEGRPIIDICSGSLSDLEARIEKLIS